MAFSLGLNYLTCYWLFETQARAVQQTYVRNQIAEEDSEAIDAARDALLSDVSGDVLTPESDEMAVMDIIDLPNPLNCWVTLEVVELVDIFLGPVWRAVTVFLLYLFQTSTLWAYAAVFSQSIATIFRPLVAVVLQEISVQPGNGTNSSGDAILTCNQEHFGAPCSALYFSFLLAYGVAETIMIIVGIKETAGVQTFLAVYRFAAIAMMVMLSLVGLGIGKSLQGEEFVSKPVYAAPSGLGVALPAITFALLLQMAVPSVMEPMAQRDGAPRHFCISLGICAMCYILIGIVLSIYLGTHTEEPVTLNFATFTGFMVVKDYEQAGMAMKALVGFCQYFILVFPLLDLFSAYALQGVVLCNNVLSLLPDRFLKDSRFLKIKVIATILMSGVPIVLAAITHSLGFIINVTGTIGMLLAITIPGLLLFQSLRVSPSQTPFTPGNKVIRFLFFSQGSGLLVALLGLVLFVYSVVEVVVDQFSHT